jgi:hypothetical protein
MPAVPRTVNRVAKRVARWYQLTCARDDARTHGLVLPSGFWTCAHCWFASIDALHLQNHLELAHTA